MGHLVRCQNNHLFSTRRYGDECPFCNIKITSQEQDDIEKRTNEDGSIRMLDLDEKVCGWLVCIEGIQSGRSYEILNGRNLIGRGFDMDIQILGDEQIDIRGHAIIFYDKKTKRSKLFSGLGNSLVYHMGEVVYEPKDLSAYDEIEMGNSKFLFIPFIGKKFSWKE
ncbi:MAG: FHA domain-containing protein [Lachnospiraceae bacterium]|nr:FHA domain-containing protein [Lachnospiraceae bacterium]